MTEDKTLWQVAKECRLIVSKWPEWKRSIKLTEQSKGFDGERK